MRRIWLFVLFFAAAAAAAMAEGTEEERAREYAESFRRTARTVLAPVYGPLAEQIVSDYNLGEAEGIGIDLGGGPGSLILELCRRTSRMTWINADINPYFFPPFLVDAEKGGVGDRVRVVETDACDLSFEAAYADIIVSRGSYHFWEDLDRAFGEIHRVLKPGGVALIGRGLPRKMPPEEARKVRQGQKGGPKYDLSEAAAELRGVMEKAGIADYRIITPKPRGSEGVNYGIWVEFRKTAAGERDKGETGRGKRSGGR